MFGNAHHPFNKQNISDWALKNPVAKWLKWHWDGLRMLWATVKPWDAGVTIYTHPIRDEKFRFGYGFQWYDGPFWEFNFIWFGITVVPAWDEDSQANYYEIAERLMQEVGYEQSLLSDNQWERRIAENLLRVEEIKQFNKKRKIKEDEDEKDS